MVERPPIGSRWKTALGVGTVTAHQGDFSIIEFESGKTGLWLHGWFKHRGEQIA